MGTVMGPEGQVLRLFFGAGESIDHAAHAMNDTLSGMPEGALVQINNWFLFTHACRMAQEVKKRLGMRFRCRWDKAKAIGTIKRIAPDERLPDDEYFAFMDLEPRQHYYIGNWEKFDRERKLALEYGKKTGRKFSTRRDNRFEKKSGGIIYREK